MPLLATRRSLMSRFRTFGNSFIRSNSNDRKMPGCIDSSLLLTHALPATSENETETQALHDTFAPMRFSRALKGSSNALFRAPVNL